MKLVYFISVLLQNIREDKLHVHIEFKLENDHSRFQACSSHRIQEPSARNMCYLLLYSHIIVYTSQRTVTSSNQFVLFKIPVFNINTFIYKAPLVKTPVIITKIKKIINKHTTILLSKT